MVAALVILADDNPDNFSSAVGIFESVGGIGMMIGPLVGSLLYSTSGNISLIHPSNITTGGNFGLPFFGAAGAEIVCLAGVMILLPRKYRKSRIEQGKNGDMTYVSVMDMMKKWRIILLVVVMSMSIASLTLLDPIFQVCES